MQLKTSSKKFQTASAALFIAIQFFIMITVQFFDGTRAAHISYTSVILSCLFCLLSAEKSKEYFFTQTALIFTVFADFFLMATKERMQLPAMILFTVAQLAYFLRLYCGEKSIRVRSLHLAVRTSACILSAVITFAVLAEKTDAVAVISVIYYANLLLNFAFATLKGQRLFAAGLLFFILCDTFVAISCIGEYTDVSVLTDIIEKINASGIDIVAIFYIPSHTILSLSAKKLPS